MGNLYGTNETQQFLYVFIFIKNQNGKKGKYKPETNTKKHS